MSRSSLSALLHVENAELFARGITPLPNYFFDYWMPLLNDTQWRLLCVIGRATLGWSGAEKSTTRRRRDWLSHSQLQRRTGRTSSAVSGAINALVRRNLIQVCNQRGESCLTPAERRRCRGKLFYQLTTVALNGVLKEQGSSEVSKTRIGKAKTTKENEKKEKLQ